MKTKRPVVVEFSGLPKSEKDVVLKEIAKWCRNNGRRVLTIPELVEKPVPEDVKNRGSITVLWSAMAALQKLLELKYVKNADCILIANGYYHNLFLTEVATADNVEHYDKTTGFIKNLHQMYGLKPDLYYVVDAPEKPSDIPEKLQSQFEDFYNSVEPRYVLDASGLTAKQMAKYIFISLTTYL